VRGIVAVLAVLALVVTPVDLAVFGASSGCTDLKRRLGQCPSAGITDDAVEIGATIESPGASGSGSDGGDIGVGIDDDATVDLRCGEGVPLGCKAIGVTVPPATDATGPLSITDIATFRPQPPTAGMQPNRWMIVGLDTNFYANTSTHIVDGTLFGDTAQVRFTPIAYHWDYGDGTTATRSTAGTTWAQQSVPEFDPTPTSHVYDSPGNYTIRLHVSYAAEYRVSGAGWLDVIGTLTIVAAPITATAGHASTVLVDKDCLANPTGVGC